MPWFNYNYPNDPYTECSYNIIAGTPSCTGECLCAIYADVKPQTIPAKPVFTDALMEAINAANNGVITEGLTRLRPCP